MKGRTLGEKQTATLFAEYLEKINKSNESSGDMTWLNDQQNKNKILVKRKEVTEKIRCNIN